MAGATLGLSACGGFAEPALQPVTKVPVARVELPPVHGKTAAFDTMALDQGNHRLYVAGSLDQGVDVRPSKYQYYHLLTPKNSMTILLNNRS